MARPSVAVRGRPRRRGYNPATHSEVPTLVLLEGKKLLITGVLTDDSIAYSIAKVAQESGAEIVLTSFGRARRRSRGRGTEPAPAPGIPRDR